MTEDSTSSLLQSLQKQNGIQTRSNGSYTISIRGSLAADRTLTLFGLSPLQAGDGSGPAYVLLGEEIFDTLYVYKGPASLYFGSKATGGALRFVPTKEKRNQLRLFAGSFDQYSASVNASVVKSDDSQLQATYFTETFKNSYDHHAGLGFNAGRWHPNHSDWTRSSVTYFYKESFTSVLFGKKDGFTPAALGFDENEYNQQASFVTHYNELSLNSENILKGQIAYLQTENENWQSGDYSKITNQNTNATLHLESLINNNFINLLQLQWNESRLRNQYTSTTKFRENELDVGIQQSHQVFSLVVEPQVRYLDKYKKWLKGLTLSKDAYYISYTEGYRSPTLNALFLEDTYSTKNPNLNPERSNQIEIGNTNEQHQLKAYFIEYQDMFKTVLSGSKYQTLNEDKAKSFGLEAKTKFKTIYFDTELSANYMKTEDTNGDPLPLSPRLQAALAISYYYGFIKIQPRIQSWYKYYLQDYTTGLERADD
ncbi:MAG: hypothetical protein KDD37_03915, partial [Bdellovibrionales bacterium]|nr:hypothetical protein [Bdellovibrionales bacterium]